MPLQSQHAHPTRLPAAQSFTGQLAQQRGQHPRPAVARAYHPPHAPCAGPTCAAGGRPGGRIGGGGSRTGRHRAVARRRGSCTVCGRRGWAGVRKAAAAAAAGAAAPAGDSRLQPPAQVGTSGAGSAWRTAARQRLRWRPGAPAHSEASVHLPVARCDRGARGLPDWWQRQRQQRRRRGRGHHSCWQAAAGGPTLLPFLKAPAAAPRFRRAAGRQPFFPIDWRCGTRGGRGSSATASSACRAAGGWGGPPGCGQPCPALGAQQPHQLSLTQQAGLGCESGGGRGGSGRGGASGGAGSRGGAWGGSGGRGRPCQHCQCCPWECQQRENGDTARAAGIAAGTVAAHSTGRAAAAATVAPPVRRQPRLRCLVAWQCAG